ncbi:AAA family ATPase [Agromyces sp. NBRC 114283]|uniref:AAA family ATPase n=1 Tax=Agromyces sp. NBRC 114283 TaxID=2994521 RepID=UPI0024A15D2B|nr:AAA family ATPase [Agromyces sp. NBRC 114283]GLU90594.1 pilus biosynthesis protein CpaE [Agromyces sp. NBRC 114283]
MVRLAVALSPELERRLLPDAIEHGHQLVARASSWAELRAGVGEHAPDVVLVGAGEGTFDRALLSACDALGIRVIALADDDRQRAAARSTGLHEVLGSQLSWSELEPVVVGRAAPDAEPPSPSAVRTIAVWGPAGAPGRTTIAVNVAAELAAAGGRVALIDADPYGGATAAALGLLDETPGFAAACRLAGMGALDRAELERLAQPCTTSGAQFDVFTGLIGAARWPELGAERVATAIAAISAQADTVVIDTGFSLERDEELTSDQFAPRRNAATFAALQAADRVTAVGLADPLGLGRLLRGCAELAEHVDPAQIDVLVNRVRPGALGFDAYGQVRSTLHRLGGIERAWLLPQDVRGADAAILRARALRDAAPRSALATAVREYTAERLLGVRGEPGALGGGAPGTRLLDRVRRRAPHYA